MRRHRRKVLASLLVGACLFSAIVTSSGSGAEIKSPPTVVLGRGHIGMLHWTAWVEESGKPSEAGEEACVAVLTIEPGVQGGTEGSESANCGSPESEPIDEVVKSPYGVVLAAILPISAKHAAIVFRGRPTQYVKLDSHVVGGENEERASRVRSVARAYVRHTCIEEIRILGSKGSVVSTVSAGRRCLG
jgi:hypothetical protein